MTTFYTRRSAIVSAQRCPRTRYWEYLALPVECGCGGQPDCSTCYGTGVRAGIMRDRVNVPLLVGSAVHAGLARLLEGDSVDTAVALARRGYDLELAASGLELADSEEAGYVADEQRALTEALVRLAAYGPVPRLLERYEVVWTERDFEQELAPGVVLRGKPDALLREKDTGDLYILSWKTKGGSGMDDRALEDGQHDDQGLSETWLVESESGEDTAGVIMIWLLKGERRETPKGSGRYTQSSPLIRGYRKFGDDGQPEYAHSYYWADGSGSRHGLGKGWSKFDAWMEPGGVKEWINLLATGHVQPDAGNPLADQFVMSAPYYRQPEDILDWVDQTIEQESAARYIAELCDSPNPWHQHRHSCSYPSRCSFYKICWGEPHVRVDPLANGYVRRRATVQVEKEGETDGE